MECVLSVIFIVIAVTALVTVKQVLMKALHSGCTDCDMDFAESLRDMLG